MEISREKGFYMIHPLYEPYIDKLNEFLSANRKYEEVDGVKFRCSEIIGGGGVRFLYGIPDSFSEEQKAISDLVTKEAIDEFGIWFRENVEL